MNRRASTILSAISLPLRIALFLLLLYISWFLMMTFHELGHVLHSWLSGGKVGYVDLPLFAFSRTDLVSNPHPQFVAWGGPLWGSLLPLLAYALLLRLSRFRKLPLFFAGFCLIANGAYLAVGPFLHTGDAAILLRHGASPWLLIPAGLLALSAGLYLWHRLGPRLGLSLRTPWTPS